MRRLTTIARTGRLTNKSVNFMRVPHSLLVEFSFCLTLFWVRFRAIRRLYSVIDLDRRGVTEPEDSGADDFVARIHSGRDCDLIAAAALDLYNLLAHTAISLTRLRVLHVGYDVHGVTVGRIVDGRRPQRNNVAGLPQRHLPLYVHAGAQLPPLILQRGLNLNVAGLLVDHRIKRRNLAAERLAGKVGAGDMQGAPDLHFLSILLRHAEVHIDRIDGLQGNDRLASGQILAEADLANSQNS